MTCLYPKQFGCWKTGNLIVPCGKCIVCRENRIKDWYVRMVSELTYCDYAYTATLTYDDDHLPPGEELLIIDVQKFFKRLRRNLQNWKLKYYYAGEYGEKGGRPHYHAVIYFYKANDSKEDVFIKETIDKCWDRGNVYLDLVSKQSVRYVLDYLQKDYYRWKEKKKVEPFQRMSNGIGLRYMLENESRISDVAYIKVGSTKFRVPKYYRRKSELINAALNEKNNERLTNDDLSEEESYQRYKDRLNGITAKAEQVERNIKQRKKIKRGTL